MKRTEGDLRGQPRTAVGCAGLAALSSLAWVLWNHSELADLQADSLLEGTVVTAVVGAWALGQIVVLAITLVAWHRERVLGFGPSVILSAAPLVSSQASGVLAFAAHGSSVGDMGSMQVLHAAIVLAEFSAVGTGWATVWPGLLRTGSHRTAVRVGLAGALFLAGAFVGAVGEFLLVAIVPFQFR